MLKQPPFSVLNASIGIEDGTEPVFLDLEE